MDLKLEKAGHALLERQHLQNRLQLVLTSIVPPNGVEKKSSLYTKKFDKEESQSLIVLFDNGIDPDPAFSGPTVARIHLNPSDQLCLTIWPQDREKGVVREEILLQNVSSFAFRFLVRNPDRTIEWKKERSKTESLKIPSLICLDINEKGGSILTLAFILPSQEPHITYAEVS